MGRWSAWRPFPDPRAGGVLHAPLGPGVYDLRDARTGEGVLFGIGGRCALRMSSLLPPPYGAGTRNNAAKRAYVWKHLEHIEYRTLACGSKEEARGVERGLRRGGRYVFMT